GIVRTCKWIQRRPFARTLASARSLRFAKGFVRIVWDQMKTSFLVLIQAVVAGASPISVVIDERILNRQKLQSAFDVEQRQKHSFKFLCRRLAQHTTELN